MPSYSQGKEINLSKMKKLDSKSIDGTVFTLYMSRQNRFYIECSDIGVTVMDFSSAKEWAKENLTQEEFEQAFEQTPPANSSFTIAVDGETMTVLERIRGNTEQSLGKILANALEYYKGVIE